MNNRKIIVLGSLILIAVVAILLYNKSRMAARSRSDIMTTIPVSVSGVKQQRVTYARSLVGTIAANADVAIVSETQGRIVKILAEVGQYRAAGTVLVEVDDELKKAAFATAETNLEKAKKDLSRFESLARESAATDQQLEGIRLAAKSAEAQFVTARREYSDTKITTPISGVVTARPVDVGTYVQKGTVIANVVDISRLKVKLNVAEQDVFRIAVGDVAEVSTDVYPGIVFTGKISTISAKADDGHNYAVEVILPNQKEHPLKAGMFGRVNFTTLANQNAITIPRTALVGSIKNPQVFVVKDGSASLRTLVLGNEAGNDVIVLSGLAEGEQIVTSGQNNLKDKSPVTVVR